MLQCPFALASSEILQTKIIILHRSIEMKASTMLTNYYY